MAEQSKRPATYADVEAVPRHLVPEIIDGVLRTHFSLADSWPLDPPPGLNEDPTPYYAGDR